MHHKEPRNKYGSIYYRQLEHDEIIVFPMLLGRARLVIGQIDDISFRDGYCYDDRVLAVEAAKVWTGEGDPLDGWVKHLNSHRVRPDGNPSKEYKLRGSGAHPHPEDR